MNIISYGRKFNKELKKYTNKEIIDIVMNEEGLATSHWRYDYKFVIPDSFSRYSLYTEAKVLQILESNKICAVTARKEFNRINRLLISMKTKLDSCEEGQEIRKEYFYKFQDIFRSYKHYLSEQSSYKNGYKEFKEFTKYISSGNNTIKERRVSDFMKNEKVSHLKEEDICYIVEKTLATINSKIKTDADKFRDKNIDNLKSNSIGVMLDYLNKIEEEFFLPYGLSFNRCICNKYR